MIIVHSFLGSKYLHVHTFENFFSAHTRKTKLIYYLYSEILNFCIAFEEDGNIFEIRIVLKITL
jgi:hypothetical protein